MNISYIRKTDKSVEEVAKRFRDELSAKGIDVVGEKKAFGGKGVAVYFSHEQWIEGVIGGDPMLMGLIPSAAFIVEKEGKTVIGIINPELLGGSPHAGTMKNLLQEVDNVLRNAVNASADVADPKLESVKLYSTATCPYCKMEKAYLEKNKVAFDLVMVDRDQAAAEDMVRKSGQMGVPVTEVVFDDGDSEIIVGFDKDRLNSLLKISA